MNEMPHEDDWLDALLEADEPYIEDDGFTEAVVARLSQPLSSRARFGILAALGATATALLLGALDPSLVEGIAHGLRDLFEGEGLPALPATLGLAALILGSLAFTPAVLLAEAD